MGDAALDEDPVVKDLRVGERALMFRDRDHKAGFIVWLFLFFYRSGIKFHPACRFFWFKTKEHLDFIATNVFSVRPSWVDSVSALDVFGDDFLSC